MKKTTIWSEENVEILHGKIMKIVIYPSKKLVENVLCQIALILLNGDATNAMLDMILHIEEIALLKESQDALIINQKMSVDFAKIPHTNFQMEYVFLLDVFN